MTVAEAPVSDGLVGEAPPSPAGPAPDDGVARAPAPSLRLPRALQTLRFSVRQIEFVFRARRELGEVFQFRGIVDDEIDAVTCHPDHVRSLFTARPDDAPSLTGESPLRPIVGPNSVLTATGPRHMRQRKLLLPPFHGEAVQRYTEMIAEAADREIDSWPVGEPFALAPRMQAITLDVIMAGIFGIEGDPRRRGRRSTGCGRRSGARSTSPRAPRRSSSSCSTWAATSRSARPACSCASWTATLRGDRGAPRGRRRAAHRHPLAAARRRDRGRRAPDRPGAARRAAHAGAGGPRDDGELARLGVRAAAAHTRAPTTGCATWPAPTTTPTATSRRPSTRRCARGR